MDAFDYDAAYRQYLRSYATEEERRASQDQFEAAHREIDRLIDLVADKCRTDPILRDAVLIVIESAAQQLRAVERACRRSRAKQTVAEQGHDEREERA